MKPNAKLHLKSALYCGLLAGMSWFSSIEYSRKVGVVEENFYPIGLAFLLSGTVAVYLAYRCMKEAGIRLERGDAVRNGKWIQDWAVVVYALPLLFSRQIGSHSYEPNGAFATATRGYGNALSPLISLLAVAGMLAFQILSRRSDGRKEPNQAPLRMPVSVMPAVDAPVAPPPGFAAL
jgi:hypothetical protein